MDFYATWGEACRDGHTLEQLFQAGMTGLRVNLSHVSLSRCVPALLREFRPAARRVSLWWLPMTANLFVCGVPAAIFALPVMPLAAHLAAFALGWLAVGGVVMTFVGLKCSDLKEQLTLELPQKGRKEMS